MLFRVYKVQASRFRAIGYPEGPLSMQLSYELLSIFALPSEHQGWT